MRVRMPGVNTVHKRLASGAVATYYYHRATGKRLQGEPGSPAFLASYAEAEATKTIAAPENTLAALIGQFQDSSDWHRLAPSSQREYRRIFKVLEGKYGTAPFEALEDRAFRTNALEWRDQHAKQAPREADYRITALARVIAWATDRAILKVNVLTDIRRAYKADRSEKIWLPEHFEAFYKVAPPELQQATTLALHTGQRQGDLIRLTWNAYDGNVIALRQSKTGARVIIPCTRALKTMLNAMPREHTVILTTSTGVAWKGKNLQHRMRHYMNKAGISDLNFHDLRGTAITMLAEAGCTEQEIASITGHSLRTVATILDKYLARTRPLSENAIAKLEAYSARKKRAGRQAHAKGSVVYFMQCGENVKIGVTVNLPMRLTSVQNGSAERVTLLHYIEGGREDERRFHAQFAHLRVGGEWYRLTGELESFLQPYLKARSKSE